MSFYNNSGYGFGGKVKFFAVFAVGLMIAGCASKTTEVKEFSGFLSSYSNLQKGLASDGAVALGWTSPDLANRTYTKVMIDPIVIYPAPEPGPQIRSEVLTNMLTYLNKAVRDRIGKNHEIVNAPGEGVLRVRAAITGVKTSAEELAVYEYVPIAMVLAGASTAAGVRDQVIEVFFEAETTDSLSGERLATRIRKGYGENLSSSSDQVEIANVRPVLDAVAKSAALYMDQLLK
jgi:Protein of unknown function (DUF3313)